MKSSLMCDQSTKMLDEEQIRNRKNSKLIRRRQYYAKNKGNKRTKQNPIEECNPNEDEALAWMFQMSKGKQQISFIAIIESGEHSGVKKDSYARKKAVVDSSFRGKKPRKTTTKRAYSEINNGSGSEYLHEASTLATVLPCSFCQANRFPYEPPTFCCGDGRVCLTEYSLPTTLSNLLTESNTRSVEFRRFIRSYNNNLAFSTFSAVTDISLLKSNRGVYTFKIQGQVHHYINDNLPSSDFKHGLYFYFYDSEMEMKQRLHVSPHLEQATMSLLLDTLSNNPYRVFLKQLKDFSNLYEQTIVLYKHPSPKEPVHNLPTVDEVAAVIPSATGEEFSSKCHIQIYSKKSTPHRIYHTYACYDPLQYPLLFPQGQSGWHQNIESLPSKRTKQQKCKDGFPNLPENISAAPDLIDHEEQVAANGQNKPSTVTCRQYYCYRLQMRDNDSSMLLHFGRLFQQFVVDMYIKIETFRLDYLRNNQNTIRLESLQGILDGISMGHTKGINIGKKIILPPSFTGGPRDYRRRYLDSMALVQKYGKPDFFITMTCNPNWPEIQNHLLPGELAQNRPDLLVRVFKSKLQSLIDEITKDHIFGKVNVIVYAIEFQKRGLPHAHILLIMQNEYKPLNPEAYDRYISAEIPCLIKFPHLNSMVLNHMMHGPCGRLNKNNVCMKNNKCKNNYPKEFREYTTHNTNSYPHYRRRQNGVVADVRGHQLDNRWVVPYNPYLLAKYNCHINVEVCSSIKLVKYIYKYIYKGPDKITFSISTNENIDEIKDYQDARWISPPEALWRIFSFKLCEMHPSVYTLQLHLPNNYPISFSKDDNLYNLASNTYLARTMLTQFFSTNKFNDIAKKLKLLYKDFPQYFVWHADKRKWTERKKSRVIGRMVTVNPIEGEKYYLRLLLNHVSGPTSFDDLYTVNGYIYSSFRDSCLARGLLNSDTEIEKCLLEATTYQMASTFRHFFCTILVYCHPENPKLLWEKFEPALSEDFTHNKNLTKIQQLDIKFKVIECLAVYIESMGKTIEELDFLPHQYTNINTNALPKEIQFEKNLLPNELDLYSCNQLNPCQKKAFEQIMSSCLAENNSNSYFIDGPGGTGKTFLYKALLAKLRSQGNIAIATATSGVAASILPGGRTAHSRFKIPINIDENSTLSLSKQSATAKLIREAKLIIWDEAPMAKRSSIESFESMLKDILDNDSPFGGKTVVFGGDFRQVLPVIRRGTITDQIDSCLINSPLWPHITKIHLHENMRAREDPYFIDFLLRVGDGREPEDEYNNIKLPEHILIPYVDKHQSLDTLINFVYPNLADFEINPYIVMNRCLLGPTNDCIEDINTYLINKFPGESKLYISTDVAIDQRNQGDYEDFLNSLNPSGLPPHNLTLKVNCPVILLRNLNPTEGFCNGTRLVCKEIKANTVVAEIAIGPYQGKSIILNKIPLQSSEEEINGVPFKRYQLPIRLCFAMTINKSQGQTLDCVGLYLREPIFSHGQLYVALSRARSFSNVKVLIVPATYEDKESRDTTRNIVIKEILNTTSLQQQREIDGLFLQIPKRLCYISEIDSTTRDWKARVTVEGKSNPHTSPSGCTSQRLVLADDKGDKVEGMIWNKNIDGLKHTLHLFKKYEITDAIVSEIPAQYRRYSNGLKIQWSLYPSTGIKLFESNEDSLLESPLKTSPISEMLAVKDDTKLTDLLAVVIKSAAPENVGKGVRDLFVQELTVVTKELKPIRLSLWNTFAHEQGSHIIQILKERPIVLCKQLKISFYKGFALQTTFGSTVIVQPTTVQGMEFRNWAMQNADAIAILAQKSDEEICGDLISIEQLKNPVPVAHMLDNTTAWTKGVINMLRTDQPCFYTACPKCRTKTELGLGEEYVCNGCATAQVSVPWCKVSVEFTDCSGIVTVTAFGKTAEIILGKTATEISEMSAMDIQLHLVTMSVDFEKDECYALITATKSNVQAGTMKYTLQQLYQEKTIIEGSSTQQQMEMSLTMTPDSVKSTCNEIEQTELTGPPTKPNAMVRLESRFEQEINTPKSTKHVQTKDDVEGCQDNSPDFMQQSKKAKKSNK